MKFRCARITFVLAALMSAIPATAKLQFTLKFNSTPQPKNEHPQYIELDTSITDSESSSIAYFPADMKDNAPTRNRNLGLGSDGVFDHLKRRMQEDWTLRIGRNDGVSVYHFSMDVAKLSEDQF